MQQRGGDQRDAQVSPANPAVCLVMQMAMCYPRRSRDPSLCSARLKAYCWPWTCTCNLHLLAAPV